MPNVNGIAIVVKAFLPTGKTLDEQFNALSIVKDAHASGDYSGLLQAATIDEVKTEQKVRRIDEPAPAPQTAQEPEVSQEEETSGEEPDAPEDAPEEASSAYEDGIDAGAVRVDLEDDNPLDMPVADMIDPGAVEPKRRRAAR